MQQKKDALLCCLFYVDYLLFILCWCYFEHPFLICVFLALFSPRRSLFSRSWLDYLWSTCGPYREKKLQWNPDYWNLRGKLKSLQNRARKWQIIVVHKNLSQRTERKTVSLCLIFKWCNRLGTKTISNICVNNSWLEIRRIASQV